MCHCHGTKLQSCPGHKSKLCTTDVIEGRAARGDLRVEGILLPEPAVQSTSFPVLGVAIDAQGAMLRQDPSQIASASVLDTRQSLWLDLSIVCTAQSQHLRKGTAQSRLHDHGRNL